MEEGNFLSLIAKLVCEFVEDKVDKVYLSCYKENEAGVYDEIYSWKNSVWRVYRFFMFECYSSQFVLFSKRTI